MKNYRAAVAGVAACAALALCVGIVYSKQKPAPATVQVHLVLTDQSLSDDGEIPAIQAESLQVKQGKNVLRVEQLIPAQGDNAALQLFLLIDDTCDSQIGNNLNDLREFIKAQPPTTMIGVAYMSNATIQVAQNLTTDHALAANALRLPRGTTSTMDSPYLSLISLVKAWPQQKVRREVIIVSDGIDRLRNESELPGLETSMPMRPSPGRMAGPVAPMNTLPSISLDADTASSICQQLGVIVHSIYSPGVGRLGRNAWELQLGQSGVAKITDETGGEYFALGTQNPVSFKPYLDRLQRIFGNQYYLVFQAIPRKKPGLQRVKISTTVAKADIGAANNVWVPAAAAAGD
jgi:hypothetical protein